MVFSLRFNEFPCTQGDMAAKDGHTACQFGLISNLVDQLDDITNMFGICMGVMVNIPALNSLIPRNNN